MRCFAPLHSWYKWRNQQGFSLGLGRFRLVVEPELIRLFAFGLILSLTPYLQVIRAFQNLANIKNNTVLFAQGM
jgi:hypothetical protein